MPKTPNDMAPEVPELQEDRDQYRGPDDMTEANEDEEDDAFLDDEDSDETLLDDEAEGS
jgi:hypothetical protein